MIPSTSYPREVKKTMGSLSLFKSFLLDLLFPMFCLICGKEGTLLCDSCQLLFVMVPPQCFVCGKLAPTPSGQTCISCRKKSVIRAFFSPFLYRQEIVRLMMHKFKYEGMRSLAPFFADYLFRYVEKHGAFPTDALFIPIPMRARKRRARGFNQSELIAIHLSGLTGIPVDLNVLKKVKDTIPQARLSVEERKHNLEGAFQVNAHAEIKHKTVILIDDVKTTGTTLEGAARALKKADVKSIWAITVAH